MTPQLGDEAGYSGCTPYGLGVARRRLRVEELLQVAVSETVNGMLAVEHCLEEQASIEGDGLEPWDVAPVADARLAECVELPDAVTSRGDAMSERFEVAVVGGGSDLEVAGEIRDAFVHGYPPPRDSTVRVELAKDLELARVIDGRRDPQGAPLVVHLDRIAAKTVLDAAPFGLRLWSLVTSPVKDGWGLRPRK